MVPQLGKDQPAKEPLHQPSQCVLRPFSAVISNMLTEEQQHMYLLVRVNLLLIHGTKDERRKGNMRSL